MADQDNLNGAEGAAICESDLRCFNRARLAAVVDMATSCPRKMRNWAAKMKPTSSGGVQAASAPQTTMASTNGTLFPVLLHPVARSGNRSTPIASSVSGPGRILAVISSKVSKKRLSLNDSGCAHAQFLFWRFEVIVMRLLLRNGKQARWREVEVEEGAPGRGTLFRRCRI